MSDVAVHKWVRDIFNIIEAVLLAHKIPAADLLLSDGVFVVRETAEELVGLFKSSGYTIRVADFGFGFKIFHKKYENRGLIIDMRQESVELDDFDAWVYLYDTAF